ncbi:MBL fold metallo-hydrolase [uncultured Ruminococcus sp.]|uniref:MBL fold metallo-hydrolase n=1 Tax=uncultured Ruminococcus sp. TaxID=165186 RepID=UPI0026270F9E|nr:MBL fold metallo-hydrolase [uncultured Ruminococcus sp.]
MKLKYYHIGIASGVLAIDDKLYIGTDPAFSPKGHIAAFKKFDSKREKAPVYSEELIKKTELWLITHGHEDHLDEAGINELKNVGPMVICDSEATAGRLSPLKSRVLAWGGEYSFEKEGISVKIKAVPAYHGNNLLMRKIIGAVNGYVVDIRTEKSGKTVYITGDTVYHKNIIKALPQKVNVMIANMGNAKSEMFGGPLTMDTDMLDSYVKLLSPEVVIPVHVDDYSHYDMTMEDIEKAGYRKIMPGDEIEC